jgi:hypothetical protein
MIDDKDFIGKFYLQHCGDTLKVIKKSNKKSIPTPRGLYLWECEFQKYPYKIYCQKSLVIAGQIINPEIERIEFVEKIWPQECGDSIRVIRKTSRTDRKAHYNYLWECEFIKYPYKIYLRKDTIIRGKVFNPAMPYFASSKEQQVFEYIRNLYGEEIISGTWKILKDYEIDIYLPKEKIGFEFNGNYWHSEHIKNKYYHLNKLKLANLKGIKLYFIWENEWDENQEKIKIWIQDILSKGSSELFKGEIDKIGYIPKGIIPIPELIKRNTSFCWNCGFIK